MLWLAITHSEESFLSGLGSWMEHHKTHTQYDYPCG